LGVFSRASPNKNKKKKKKKKHNKENKMSSDMESVPDPKSAMDMSA